MSAKEIVEQPDEDIEQICPPLAGENNAWYSRLVEYLRLGPGRSVRGVYNREKGNEISKAVPASWTQASHRYEWQRRAVAYDAWRRAAVFATGNASDVERVKKLDTLVDVMHSRLIAGIDEIEINEKYIERYLAVLDLLARHTGGYGPQRIEHTGKDGTAIQIEGESASMQVVFYLPEVDALPEIGVLPGSGEAHTLDGAVNEEVQ